MAQNSSISVALPKDMENHLAQLAKWGIKLQNITTLKVATINRISIIIF